MADFVLLLKEFDIAGNLYLLQLCNTAQALFQDGNYFDEAYDRLKAVLLNPVWAPKDADNIAILSQHLTVELLLKGYSLKSVGSFPRNLFEIVNACGLNQPISGAVTISPFISNLPLLTANIDRKLIKDRCEFTHSFYTNHKFAQKQIEERIKQIKEDILLIYRYRNKIVHNARFDNIILPYFVEKAGIYATELLKRIVYAYTADEGESIEGIVVTAYVRLKRVLEKLERDIPVDFLNLAF